MIETVIIVLILFTIWCSKKDWSFWLVLSTVIFYMYMQFRIFNNHYELLRYSDIIKYGTIGCYFIMAYKNKIYQSIGVAGIIMTIGLILNWIVIQENGGYMPIYPTWTLESGYTDLNVVGVNGDYHILGTGNPNIKLWWLADIWDIGYCIMSNGDVLIRIGMGILLFFSIKSNYYKKIT